MTSLALPSVLRAYWQARPTWTAPVAIAIGLHGLLLALPVGIQPLGLSNAPLAPSRGALVDLSDQLRLRTPQSSSLQPLQLPDVGALPVLDPEFQRVPLPALPPSLGSQGSPSVEADASLITVQPSLNTPEQPSSSPVAPSAGSSSLRPSLEEVLNSITQEDQALMDAFWYDVSVSAKDQTRWNKRLGSLEYGMGWFAVGLNQRKLQRPAPEELIWPQKTKLKFRLEWGF